MPYNPFVDSQVLFHSWNRRGSRSHSLVTALKCLFSTTMHLNVDLHVYYVRGPENPADPPSLRLSFQDSRLENLKRGIWSKVCMAVLRVTPLTL